LLQALANLADLVPIMKEQTAPNQMSYVLTGDQITQFRAKALLSALKLECLGMKRNGPSAYATVKAEYNLKGNKASVYDQLAAILG
jgi:hypothetical protein